MEDVTELTEWQRKTRRLEDADGVVIAWCPDISDRPPFGPPLAGSRATLGGRGNRRSQSVEAKDRRALLALQAFRMRLDGRSVREIAHALGIGKTTAGKWLYGVTPRDPQRALELFARCSAPPWSVVRQVADLAGVKVRP